MEPWHPWLASWGLVCATVFIFQEYGQTGFFSPLWLACASPVLHVTLQVTLLWARVGIARETVRGGEGAMSDVTGLSAFCCLVTAECSLGRVARACLAAQYLSSVCVGPTCLQDNFFLMPLLPIIFVPNHLTFSNSFIQHIVPKHLPYELGTQRWWQDRQNLCFVSTYKWKRQQTNISSMKKTLGVQKGMHLGFAPLLS